MNIDEFLSTASQQATDVYNKFIPKFNENMVFEVYYDDASRVEHNEGLAKIHIKTEEDVRIMEQHFMHEFFHCVQAVEGFPSLYWTDEKYKKMTIELSSAILDLDVRDRLKENGYSDEYDNVRILVNLLTKQIKLIEKLKDKKELTTIDDILNAAFALSTADIGNINTRQLKQMISIQRPKIMSYYRIIDKCLDTYTYKTPEGTQNIFETLINQLSLNEFMYIE